MRKQDDYGWLKKWLKKITDLAEKIQDKEVANEYGCYTTLKLISVLYYSEVFTNVALSSGRNIQGFDGAVYIDLFAGSGLVKLEETADYVAGSPLCAALNKNGFNLVVCVESDISRKIALENRLGSLLPNDRFKVFHGDCNKIINEVVDYVNSRFKRPIVLTFVDPEGMEIKWGTLQTVSDAFLTNDFVVNVSSSGVHRVRGKLEKGIDNVSRSMSEYYDEPVEKILFDLASGKTPEKKYQEKINNMLGKVLGNNIRIRIQGNRTAYYILCYTRETSGGSPYMHGFDELKKRIEWADADKVKNILDQIKGRTATII